MKSKILQQLLDGKEISVGYDKESVEQTDFKKTVDFDKVYDSIAKSEVEVDFSRNHLSLVFHDCRVLSLNQIFSLLQRKPKPFQIMKYKKLWHEKMFKEIHKMIESGKELPDFKDIRVKIYVYRESSKLIDADNIYASYKYMIDGLRQKHKIGDGEYAVLDDDNPNFVSVIRSTQVLSKENNIAIKIVPDFDKKEQPKNIMEFLNENAG